MLEGLGIRFQTGGFLYLLFAIPLIVLLWQLAVRRKQSFRQDAFEQPLADLQVRRTSHLSHLGVERLRYVGYTLVLLVLIVALAQPQLLRERISEIRGGVDTVLILDISYSMLAEDIVPSRLQKAKDVIRDFIIRKPPSDRVGLVIFAENSLVLSYLSKDPENLLFFLDFLEPQYGTNMGRAVKSGLRIFERQDEVRANEKGAGTYNSRVMILVSDGEDEGHELDEALHSAVEAKIKTYTIGVGSRRTVPIPIGREGALRQYLFDDKGNQVFTQFSEATLRDIAARTGGRFYRSFVGTEMAHAFDEILMKEREIRDFKVSNEYLDIYHYFLLGSLGIFSLLLILDRQ